MSANHHIPRRAARRTSRALGVLLLALFVISPAEAAPSHVTAGAAAAALEQTIPGIAKAGGEAGWQVTACRSGGASATCKVIFYGRDPAHECVATERVSSSRGELRFKDLSWACHKIGGPVMGTSQARAAIVTFESDPDAALPPGWSSAITGCMNHRAALVVCQVTEHAPGHVTCGPTPYAVEFLPGDPTDTPFVEPPSPHGTCVRSRVSAAAADSVS